MSQKQPITVYTMMLIVANIFMFFACLLMAMEWIGGWGGASSAPAPTRVQWVVPSEAASAPETSIV